jgi:transketolase
VALEMKKSPSAFVCSRQNLALLPKAVNGEASKGGYLLQESANATITLMASGSEVELAMNTRAKLAEKGVNANVVSVPCFDLLIEQDKAYLDSIIKTDKVVAIEAARGLEWYRFADEIVNMDTFGASAPAGQLFEKFGFTPEAIANRLS